MAEEFKDMLDFMQKMWNPLGFAAPGMMQPTVDPAELEKRIAELRTIENWLKMNQGFLQMTIKTLEMQKSALDAFSASARGPAAKG